MDFKHILQQFADAENTVKLNEAAFAKSGVKADAKKNKADATTRKQYFIKLTNAKGGSKGVTEVADEGETQGEVRDRVARDHKSQGWIVSSIREKEGGDGPGEDKPTKPALTASGKKRGRPPGSKKAVTEGRQTVSEYIAEAKLMEKSMTDAQKSERERIVKGMKKAKGSFEKRYPGRGEEVMYATATKRAMKESQQDMVEGALNEGQYEMMMRNGQVKKFIAKNDADAKRIAAGHGAKSVIKLRGGVPAGKVAEQGVTESAASKFSPEMHDRIKNATPEQLSQMADNFAGPIGHYDYELELLMKAQKELRGVTEGTECNHTMEGEECPVHGLEECGSYMEESQFDEDLASMKKIAGVGALAATTAGLGAHISSDNDRIRDEKVEKLEKQVASEPNAVKRGQLEKMIADIKSGKPLSKGDLINEISPHQFDNPDDYYDALDAEAARRERHASGEDDYEDDDDMRESSEDEAEYSDEVGMVTDNLGTIERAAEELESILHSNEDLPEWVQEKVSNAKAMLVSAKDYMISQHKKGDIHHIGDEEMEEGNEFSGELAKAKAAHKDSFEVDGKTYPVKESRSAVDELAECYDMAYQQAQAEPGQRSHMSVSANTSSEGNRTLTVTAEGDMADELAQLLSLSGLVGHAGHHSEMDEGTEEVFRASTTPNPTTYPMSTITKSGDDLNSPKAQHPGAAARGDNPLGIM